MAKYDIENFLSDIETYFKANLNTHIAAINTEKGDSLLSSVSTGSYTIQSLDAGVVNQTPMILIGVSNIESNTLANVNVKTYSVDIIIIIEKDSDFNNIKRLWRYQRAIEDTVKAAYNSILRSLRLKVESLVPVEVAINNKSQLQLAIGVGLLVELKN